MTLKKGSDLMNGKASKGLNLLNQQKLNQLLKNKMQKIGKKQKNLQINLLQANHVRLIIKRNELWVITIKEKQQLNEYVQVSDANQIEQVNDKGVKEKHWYLNGIFMQGEIENLNGRIYPRSEIEYAVDSLKQRKKLKQQNKEKDQF